MSFRLETETHINTQQNLYKFDTKRKWQDHNAHTHPL